MTKFLDPTDAAFVLLEVPGSSMNIGAIIELDAGDVTDPAERYRIIRQNIEARLHEIPALGRRLIRAPFDLTWPILVPDRKIDLDRHIVRVALPAPGSPDQFDALIGDFLSKPLVRYRPLWQMLIIEGLPDNRCAVALKVHHALADGVSGAETFANLFDISPDVRAPLPFSEEEDAAITNSFALAWRSAKRIVRNPALLVGVVLGWVRRIIEILKATVTFLLARRRRHVQHAQPSVFEAKRTSLNGAPGIEKDYRRTRLSLADVKRAAKSRGATVTDFVMCVASGALGRLMAERGEVLRKDLVAFVPINVRGSGDAAALGNQISGMLVRLHTDESDPERRLQAIAADSATTVEGQREHRAKIFHDIPLVLGPAVLSWAGRLLHATGAFNRTPPIANLMISSVPGPPIPLWLSGQRVHSACPVGPLFASFSLNITVLGFEEFLEFGLYASVEHVPDLAILRDYILEEGQKLIASTPNPEV